MSSEHIGILVIRILYDGSIAAVLVHLVIFKLVFPCCIGILEVDLFCSVASERIGCKSHKFQRLEYLYVNTRPGGCSIVDCFVGCLIQLSHDIVSSVIYWNYAGTVYESEIIPCFICPIRAVRIIWGFVRVCIIRIMERIYRRKIR